MKPKAFILYPNQWEALKELSLEGVGYLFTAIYRSMNGEDVEDLEKAMSRDVLLAFRFLMIQINVDYTKYLDKVEKNKERQQRFRDSERSKKRNALDKERGNESDKEKERDDEEVSAGADKQAAASQQPVFLQFKEAASRDIMPWINEILRNNESMIPKLRRMTDWRIRRLFDLMNEYGNGAIGEALRKAASSPFLNGRGKRNKFVATIDWVLSEEHFLEVLEGKYNTSV